MTQRSRALLAYLEELEVADPTPQSTQQRVARRAAQIRDTAIPKVQRHDQP